MTAVITHPGGTIYPTLIEGFESSSESGNIRQPVAGRAAADYSLNPSSLRTGTLTLVFGDAPASSSYVFMDGYIVAVDTPAQDPETASRECEIAHNAGEVMTLAAAEISTVLMTYVLREGGSVTRRLDPQTRRVWVVTVDFEEVL